MFGYIRPYKAEMLVREYETYKSIYCALCRKMGKEYGALSRFTLSYDCTFYALLMLSLTESKLAAERKCCAANPLKKCNYCITGDAAWKEASALSVLLTYQKLRDDKEDSSFWKGLPARLLLPAASAWRKKAQKKYPHFDQMAQDYIRGQKEAETREDFSFDLCAEPTALFLAELFSHHGEGAQKRVLYEMGYHMGRWVYFIDAADDMGKDLKEGSFNPFIKRFGLTEAQYEAEKQMIHEKCNEVLNFSLAEAVSAMRLLDFASMSTIVENIVAKGSSQIQKEILFTEKKKVKRNVRPV